jgi:hypothetical protein
MRRFSTTAIRTAPVIVALSLLTLLGPAATAQEESGCTLPPLSLPLFDATPAAIVAATPVAAEGPVEVHEEEIREAVEMIVTCANSADPKLVNAIFTERYLAERFADPATTSLPVFEQSLDHEDGIISTSLVLDGVEEITPLDDGRVSAVAVISSSTSTFRDTLILANVDGAWLIDDLGELDPAPRTSRP